MVHLSQTNAKGFVDLVFDRRNQAYGAYVLRREYPVNVLKSLLIGIAIVAGILAIPYLTAMMQKKKPINHFFPPIQDTVVFHPVGKLIDTDKRKIDPPPKRNGNDGVPIIVEEVVPVDTFTSLQPTQPGLEGGKGEDLPIAEGKEGELKPPLENVDSIHNFVDRYPGFPGGNDALHEFLGNNLDYPEDARRIGIEGKVYVTFVVDELGNVVNVKVPRPIGGGCDEEAIRVVEMMPRWEPGLLKGKPVKVTYQLPIIFRLN